MSEKSKNETKIKTVSVSNKDTVKDSKQTSTKKPNDKRKRFSDAGKGDKVRRGITQDEWRKKWEEIFRPKKKKFIRSHKSNNSSSKS